MLAQHFVTWCEMAGVSERCAGVALLADAVMNRRFLPSEIRQAEAALVFALDDPSPRVRATLSGLVCRSDAVPRQLVRSLSADIDEVALPVVTHSPLLCADDLVALASGPSAALRLAVAGRAGLEARVADAIALGDDAAAALALLRNGATDVPPAALRRITDVFGREARMRDALLRRDDLPADLRHSLLLALGESLCQSPFVLAATGPERAARLRGDVTQRATAALIDAVAADEVGAFVEHLRGTGHLNAAVLLRAVCAGRIDLFASSLARLARLPEPRVRAIVADAREPAFAALLARARLPDVVVPVMLCAVRAWRDVSAGDGIDETEQGAAVMERVVRMIRRRYDAPRFADLGALVHDMAAEVQDAAVRRRAETYLAA